MSSTTIRLREDTRAALKEISSMTGETMQEALNRAVQERRRRLYLDGLDAEYAELRQDSAAWQEAQAEWALWDGASDDGLEER